MSRVRGRGNRTTELTLLTALRRARIAGWRRHYSIPGTPDFCFPSLRIAVFVDGCFWHRCPRHGSVPTGNRTYWLLKLTRNSKRDIRVGRELRTRGWRVVRLWEHDLKGTPKVPGRLLRALLRAPAPKPAPR